MTADSPDDFLTRVLIWTCPARTTVVSTTLAGLAETWVKDCFHSFEERRERKEVMEAARWPEVKEERVIVMTVRSG